MEMFDKAGGVDKVNQEAKVAFERFGTEKTKSLSGSDSKDFPAISTLGSSVVLYGANPSMASEITIRFGTHRNTKFIHIFPLDFDASKAPKSSNVLAVLDDAKHFQIASNIFVEQ